MRPRTKYEENFARIEDGILKMLLSSGYENTSSNVHGVCSRLAVDLLPDDAEDCARKLKAAFDRASEAGVLTSYV